MPSNVQGPRAHKATAMQKICLLLFGVCILAACSRTPPSFKNDLPMEIPSAWSTQPEVEGELPDGWVKDFNSPQLAELILTGLEYNYDLQATAARLRIINAEVTIAGADRLPQFSAHLREQRERRNFIGFPGGLSTEEEVISNTTNSSNILLDFSWELDLWGRLQDQKLAAVGDFQAAQADLWGARLSLAAQIAKAWFATIESERQLELIEGTAQSFSNNADLIQKRFNRGLSSALDLRLARANALAAESGSAGRKRTLDERVRTLEVLLGSYPADQLNLGASFPILKTDVPVGLPSKLLTRRPDLIAAEHRLAAADLRVSEARKALLPRIRLTSSAGTTSEELGDLLDSDFFVWNLTGNLLQPIFEGGRLRANVKRAQAVSQETLANYAATVLNAFREVETALAAEAFLKEEEEGLRLTAEESVKAEKIAWDRYQKGLIDIITTLEAQRRAFTTQRDYIATRLRRLNNRVNLYLALGGEFKVGGKEPSADKAVSLVDEDA